MTAPVVLITGCSTGIGRATAKGLAEAGYTVVATARRMETLADLPTALKLPLDVTDPESVTAAVKIVLQTYGRIDFLINNAGYGQTGALEDVSEEQLHKVFEVNVHGLMRMIRAVAPIMRNQGSGRIVNISSVLGRISLPMMGAYCGTKHAVEAMSDALRSELRPFGIQVVLIEPGAIRTEFEKTAWGGIPASENSAYTGLYGAFQHVHHQSGRTAPGPDVVARVIRRAMEAGHPRARYQVPASAFWMVALVPKLGARILDRALHFAMTRLGRSAPK